MTPPDPHALAAAANALRDDNGDPDYSSCRRSTYERAARIAITTYLAALPELDPFDWLHERGVVLRRGGFEGDPIYHGGHSERHLRDAWRKAQRPSTPEAGDE